jgi:inner membrane protein
VASNPISGLIPRGSLGLKLLLVCLLVLVMGIPLLVVGGLVGERESRARSVTAQIGADAGGSQVVGGPMLIVPYTRTIEVTDDQGRTQRRADRGIKSGRRQDAALDAAAAAVILETWFHQPRSAETCAMPSS